MRTVHVQQIVDDIISLTSVYEIITGPNQLVATGPFTGGGEQGPRQLRILTIHYLPTLDDDLE